ncbi:hypothetical protein XENTR_v10010167 [Xenopus tropicalis]|uniref:Histidine N-acetyltransferase n=1 Tax=Xenopus tropicalis TaxID=8364 RepID=A0A8J0R807_XENTR|nr:histidine N-acetyltransferase [Xenopus tropicalis]KAE8620254.1 hypothetical protein XENTR_v10010167 [Xenopus tropicalis]
MSRPTPQDIQVRPATARDYEQVMSISEGVYSGVDYLPVRYHEWLEDPQRRMFLAKFDGRVVGFESFVVVDAGVTAVLQGLRVSPRMRGRGVAGIMQQTCIDNLRSNYPDVTRIRLTRLEEPTPSMLSKYRMLHSKAVVSVILPHDQLDHAVKLLKHRVQSAYGRRPLVVLTPEAVLSLFENSCTAEVLLPKGLLIQGWLPLSTHRSNLELLLQRGVVWFHSEHCEETSDSAKTSKSRNTSDAISPSSEFLSLGTPPYSVPLGDGMHRFDIDLFGTDPIAAQAHVLHQLIEGVRLLPTGGGVICFLYAEKSLEAVLTQFCQGITPFPLWNKQLVLEQDI